MRWRRCDNMLGRQSTSAWHFSRKLSTKRMLCKYQSDLQGKASRRYDSKVRGQHAKRCGSSRVSTRGKIAAVTFPLHARSMVRMYVQHILQRSSFQRQDPWYPAVKSHRGWAISFFRSQLDHNIVSCSGCTDILLFPTPPPQTSHLKAALPMREG